MTPFMIVGTLGGMVWMIPCASVEMSFPLAPIFWAISALLVTCGLAILVSRDPAPPTLRFPSAGPRRGRSGLVARSHAVGYPHHTT